VNRIGLEGCAFARLALMATPSKHLGTVYQVVHDPPFHFGDAESNRFLT
jgi:hypothetical protein